MAWQEIDRYLSVASPEASVWQAQLILITVEAGAEVAHSASCVPNRPEAGNRVV